MAHLRSITRGAARPHRLRTLAYIAAGAACGILVGGSAQAAVHPTKHSQRAVAGHATAAITKVSRGCPGQNAKPIEAVAPPARVYIAWIGCGGIGFARSTDGGHHFSTPMLVPGSKFGGSQSSWDPSLTVAPNGTVYVAYMLGTPTGVTPVVAASFDRGASFPQVVHVAPG